MNRLTELGLKYYTDKTYDHGFTEFYHAHVLKYVNAGPKLFEIGVSEGRSLRMWEEFFGNATIVGMDIHDMTKHDSKCITTFIGDQEKPSDLLKCLNYADGFDIIVDDGGHTMKQQLITFATLFPLVKSGGIYILEDLHTSFHGIGYNPDGIELTAYAMVEKVRDKEPFETPCFTKEQMEYVLNNSGETIIWTNHPNNTPSHCTSIIYKK